MRSLLQCAAAFDNAIEIGLDLVRSDLQGCEMTHLFAFSLGSTVSAEIERVEDEFT